MEQTGIFDWTGFTYSITNSAFAGHQLGGSQLGLIGYGILLFGLLGLAAGPDPQNTLSNLAAKVERLKQGDYDVDFPTSRNDDIGQLSRSLEELADQLYECEQQNDFRRGGKQARKNHDQNDFRRGGEQARKNREENDRLREDERDRFAALFENTPNAIAQVTLTESDASIQSVNSRFVDTFGCERSEVLGESFFDLLLPEERDRASHLLQRVRDGAHLKGEHRKQTTDGERWFLIQFVPIGDTPVTEGYVVYTDITERQEREYKLERYKEYTDDVLDAIDDIFYVLDEDGNLLRWNEAFTEAMGYSDEEMAEMHSLELVPEEQREKAIASIETVFEQGSCSAELVFLTRDGERIPYETAGAALEDPEGKRVAAGVGRDLTERRQRERRIAQQHERLQAIAENVPVVLFALDSEGRFTLLEGQGVEKLSHEPDEILGRTILDAYSDNPAIVEPAQRALDGTQVSASIPLDGLVWDTWYEPILDDGEVERVIGVAIDVTERKRHEQELRERERELSTLMDNIPGMVYRAKNDPDWPFEFVSDGSRDVTGYEPELLESGAINWAEDVIDGDHDELWGAVQRAVENREPYRVLFPIVTADGETRWVWEQGRGVFDEEGRLEALEGVITDVTEQKQTEQELERTKDLLEQTQRIASVGGWEYDMTTSPPYTGSFTDELYRIHELPAGTDIYLKDNLDYYPGEHRERLKEAANLAVETGEPYDVEARFVTARGNERWVRTTGVPVYEDGDLVKVRGALQDITRQKERELALESLQQTAQGLLGAETNTEVTNIVIESASQTFDVPGVAIYLLNEETSLLEPAAFTPTFTDLCGDPEPVPIDQGDSALWNSFVSDTQEYLHGEDALCAFGPAVERGLVVPMDDYGVFVLATPEPAVDDETSRLVGTLVATTEAALDRLENEAILRERESELATRNERLTRQVQINTIIRSIHRSLIGAESRDEIERAVCERLTDAENVALAWIGTLDTNGGEMELRAWDGPGQDYLDEQLDTEGTEPAVVTAQSGKPTVVSNVVEGLGDEDWRQRALMQNFHSVVSVPLSFDDFSFGILTVYANEPGTFSDLERAVFAELGESIANSIMAVNTRKALHADTLVELTLRITDDSFLTRVAREADCQVEYEGLATHSTDESSLFFTTTGTDAQTVLSVLSDLVSVTDCRLVSEDADICLFEATLTGETLPARLIRHGGSPRSIRVVEGGIESVVDVPTTTDLREFVEMLETEYAGVELLGRRDVGRSMQTRQEFLELLLGELTERQQEVLKTAYYAGFFDWPRASTGEEIAEMLGVTQPTINRHLRLSQQRLLDGLFEGGISADD